MGTITASMSLVSHLTQSWLRPASADAPRDLHAARRGLINIREDGIVRNKAIYLALRVMPDGTRDVPGV